MSANLYELIRQAAPANATSIESLAGERFTYGDLDRQSARLANALRASGVVKGDRIAVQVEKCPQAVPLVLASLRLGAAYLPLNTAYTLAELDYFFADAEPRVIVCDPGAQSRIAGLPGAASAALLTLDGAGQGTLSAAAKDASENFETVSCDGEDLAAIVYTSGTTGRSKGAMLTHANLASNALTLREIWGFTRDDVLLHALPIYHVHGLFVALNTALLSGTRLMFMPRFDADTVIGQLPHATAMMGVPTFYTRLLAHQGFNRDLCANMRLFISGSAPLLEDTFNAFEQRTGHRILERYGMTETGMNASNPLDRERRAGTVGPPLPDVTLRVVDDSGTPVAAGENGMLEIRGPNVFKGYWRMPEKTQESFRDDGFFISGDIAQISPDGYVTIVGRDKDMIISGGLNVYPKEIESVIDAIPGVSESAVIGVPHPDFGEAVVAIVRSQPKGPDIDEAAIIAATREQLAAYKVPKRIVFTDALPRNAMAKVQKNVLRDTHQNILET